MTKKRKASVWIGRDPDGGYSVSSRKPQHLTREPGESWYSAGWSDFLSQWYLSVREAKALLGARNLPKGEDIYRLCNGRVIEVLEWVVTEWEDA